jgi:hypothetical protein
MAKPLDTGAVVPSKTGMVAVDREIQGLADRINELKKNAIVAVEVLNVRPSTSPTTLKLQHGLGRAPRGWSIWRMKNASPDALFEITAPQPDRELWLSYTGSTDIVLDFRIY